MSVASHSMTNGRSWFFGLHLFCPAKVCDMPAAWTSPADRVPGTAPSPPPQAANTRNVTERGSRIDAIAHLERPPRLRYEALLGKGRRPAGGRRSQRDRHTAPFSARANDVAS